MEWLTPGQSIWVGRIYHLCGSGKPDCQWWINMCCLPMLPGARKDLNRTWVEVWLPSVATHGKTASCWSCPSGVASCSSPSHQMEKGKYQLDTRSSHRVGSIPSQKRNEGNKRKRLMVGCMVLKVEAQWVISWPWWWASWDSCQAMDKCICLGHKPAKQDTTLNQHPITFSLHIQCSGPRNTLGWFSSQKNWLEQRRFCHRQCSTRMDIPTGNSGGAWSLQIWTQHSQHRRPLMLMLSTQDPGTLSGCITE